MTDAEKLKAAIRALEDISRGAVRPEHAALRAENALKEMGLR